MNLELGKAIKMARVERGHSQVDMAKEFNVAQQTIGGWEATGKVAKRHWIKLLEKYNLDVKAYEGQEVTITTSNQNGNNTSNIADTVNTTNHIGNTKLSHQWLTLIDLVESKENPDVVILDFIKQMLLENSAQE